MADELTEQVQETIDMVVAYGTLGRKLAVEETERKRREDQMLRLTRAMALAMRNAAEEGNQEVYKNLREGLIEAFGVNLVNTLEEQLEIPEYA